MKYQQLIAQSRINLAANPPGISGGLLKNIFESGANWMCDKLNENNTNNQVQFNRSTNYLAYGLLKYAVSFLVFLFSAFIFFKVNVWLLPIPIIMFYFAEVHFVFLFPMLIDQVKNPVWSSIKQTYKTGIVTALTTVIPIGFFMMYGLLKIKDPLRNWYVGCLAIIIWYQNEVRNRL